MCRVVVCPRRARRQRRISRGARNDGGRFLPATLATDDPFVADELSLPTIFHIKVPGSRSPQPPNSQASAGSSRSGCHPNLGVSVAGAWDILAPKRRWQHIHGLPRTWKSTSSTCTSRTPHTSCCSRQDLPRRLGARVAPRWRDPRPLRASTLLRQGLWRSARCCRVAETFRGDRLAGQCLAERITRSSRSTMTGTSSRSIGSSIHGVPVGLLRAIQPSVHAGVRAGISACPRPSIE